MEHECKTPADEWGLLANGSAGCWNIEVDETLDGKQWLLEIEGPQTYLAFQLRDLQVLARALKFLTADARSKQSNGQDAEAEDNALELGRFGSATVSLLRDNEDFPRCFLVIRPEAGSCLQLSF